MVCNFRDLYARQKVENYVWWLCASVISMSSTFDEWIVVVFLLTFDNPLWSFFLLFVILQGPVILYPCCQQCTLCHECLKDDVKEHRTLVEWKLKCSEERNLSQCTMSINFTWTAMGLRLGLRCEKLVTKCLNCGIGHNTGLVAWWLKLFLFLPPGREFFVGLSEWTNEAGARAVAAAFPDFPCTPVKVRPCADTDENLDLDIQARGNC
jgi:hypothetical protein